MHYDKLNVDEISVYGKRVLLRVDFNVPLIEGRVGDDTRIRAVLPTIRYLLAEGARVLILASHLGRPRGQVVPELRLDPVARHLETLLGRPVKKMDQVIGRPVREAIALSEPGTVVLLENLRFEAGEEKNDPLLSRRLAELADLFVNDAFGTAHRAHASTAGVADHIPAVAGLLMKKEMETLTRCLKNPRRPLVVILGGAKISGKLGVIKRFLSMADCLLTGGGMAHTLLAAQGYDIADSLYEPGLMDVAKELLSQSKDSRSRLLLPADLVVAKDLQPGSIFRTVTVPSEAVPAGWKAVDIGPLAIEQYCSEIAKAGMVVWNGPLGIFEKEPYHRGTEGVARAIAASEAYSVVGGGDIAAALEKFGLTAKINFVSTGGGATLKFWEDEPLPGIVALKDR